MAATINTLPQLSIHEVPFLALVAVRSAGVFTAVRAPTTVACPMVEVGIELTGFGQAVAVASCGR